MKKRTLCLLLSLLLVFTVCGCKKKNDTDDSEYSVWYEDEIISGSSGSKADKTTSSKKNNSSKSGSKASGGQNTASDHDTQIAEETKLDFGGKTITLLRDWDKYERGKWTTWDNWLNNLDAVEKECNVKIVEKKWTADLASEMLAGVKPEGNIYLVSSGSVYSLATKGYITDLNSAMKKTGIDMTGELFNKVNTQLNNINGKQYTIGLGFARVPVVVIYNKTMTKKAGFDIAQLVKDKKWTWDKMTEVAKATTIRSGSGEISQYGVAFDYYAPAALAVSNNSNIVGIGSNGSFQLKLSDTKTKKALDQLYNWVNVDKVADYNWGQKAWNQNDIDFANKKYAMLLSGHVGIQGAYSNLTDEWSLAYLPMGPDADDYVSYIQDEYSYVIPSSYADMAPDLLVLLTKMHRLPKGYTLDDEFRDEWIRFCKDNETYQILKTLHDGSVKQVWDATLKFTPSAGSTSYTVAFAKLFEGKLNSGAFIDTYSTAFQKSVDDMTKKVKYTGNMK